MRRIYLRSTHLTTNLTSPGFPLKYRNDLICLWTIIGREDSFTVLSIVEFQLERGYDFLTIGIGAYASSGSGDVIARLTGLVKLRTITSPETTMWIQIATDRTGIGNGFHIELGLTNNRRGKSNMS